MSLSSSLSFVKRAAPSPDTTTTSTPLPTAPTSPISTPPTSTPSASTPSAVPTAVTTAPTTSAASTSTSAFVSSGSVSFSTSASSISSGNPSSISAVPTPSGSTASQPLSPGAIAGISIAAFFAGLILAFLGFCLFARLRKKKDASYDSTSQAHQRPYRDSEHSQDQSAPTKYAMSSVLPVGVGNDMNLNRILLEPASSSDIKTDMLTIGSQILQHVDNNYHLKPVDSLPASFVDALKQDGYTAFTGISINHLGNLLRNIETRRAAIRHLISYFIFSKITFTGTLENSLLPSHLITFLKEIPPPERSSGSREALDQVLSKWRVLSAYLLQTVRSNRDPLLPPEEAIQPAITRILAIVRPLLQPFVTPGAERRQADNLQGLMAEGARFGLLLFQQPDLWLVDWDLPRAATSDAKTAGPSDRARPSAIIVFPGLIRTANGEGKTNSKVRAVLDAEVLQV